MNKSKTSAYQYFFIFITAFSMLWGCSQSKSVDYPKADSKTNSSEKYNADAQDPSSSKGPKKYSASNSIDEPVYEFELQVGTPTISLLKNEKGHQTGFLRHQAGPKVDYVQIEVMP